MAAVALSALSLTVAAALLAAYAANPPCKDKIWRAL